MSTKSLSRPLFFVNNGDKPLLVKKNNPGIGPNPENGPQQPRPWWDIMLEQLANATLTGLIGGIAGFIGALAAGVDVSKAGVAGAIGFGVGFCSVYGIELRKFR